MTLQDFLNKEGRVSSTRTTEKYVKKKFPEEFLKIKSHSEKLGLVDVTFSEELYHYLNNLKSQIKCKNCKEKKSKFTGLINGYIKYCSYGCSNGSKEVKELKSNAYFKKYGVENPSKSLEIKSKIEETFRKKYGGNPFTVFRERIEKTNMEKYGSIHALSKESSLRSKKNQELLELFIQKYKQFEVIDYEEIKTGTCRIRCEKCENDYTISKWNLHQRVVKSKIDNPCTLCNPVGSSNETGIENFIKEILDGNNITYVEKDRKILGGKEIDFYLPDKKIGIEVNGLFWHSEKFKDKKYHLQKTRDAQKKGIHLIQIFEDEIKINPKTVEGRLKSLLGIYDKKVFARNCLIGEVSSEECKKFLEKNHVQGNIGSKVKLGLFHRGKLVSVMTFGSYRISLGNKDKSQNKWELLRFSNENGYLIVGGASKLLKNFIKNYNPEEIVSYCDRRWSTGNFYEKIGFCREAETKVNYWYVKNGIREGRFKYRKDQLVKEGYSKEKTESEIMEERGFLKIYDCGSFKFKMRIDLKT